MLRSRRSVDALVVVSRFEKLRDHPFTGGLKMIRWGIFGRAGRHAQKAMPVTVDRAEGLSILNIG